MQEISFEKTWVRKITALYILRLLEEKKVAYGNQLIEEISTRTKKILQPNPNSIYPLLRLMEERGYVVGKWEHPDRKSKRIYEITDFGREKIKPLEEKVAERFLELENGIQILRNDLMKKKGTKK